MKLRRIEFIKNTYQEAALFRHRFFFTTGLAIFLLLLLISRLLYLQVIQRDYFSTLSKNNEINVVPVSPKRGIIYDRNGIIVAQNIPVFSLMVTPDKVSDLQNTIDEVNKIVPLSASEVEGFYKQLKQHRRFDEIPLKLRLSDLEVARFSLDQYRFPGVSVKAELIRDYPYRGALVHVLGYVGRISEEELAQLDPVNYAATNFIGKIGAEKFHEKLLHGKVGYKKIETDASGQSIREVEESPPAAGSDLYLTIDSHLQMAAEKALGNNRGAVVAIQPATGEVLTMASQPAYDPQLFLNSISLADYLALQKDKARPLYNRAIRGLYPPGSTIKPFVALQGLNIGIITPPSRIYDPGWYQLPNADHVYHDWQLAGHGWVDVTKAIIESCDTFFYDLAHKLGIKRLDEMLGQFGIGDSTGIDLNEELPGNLPTPEWKMRAKGQPWFSGDTVNAGIGQGFMQVTPLQLANATAILAMRGQGFKPHLLAAIRNADNRMVYLSPIPWPPIYLQKESTWNLVINAMSRVTTEGTGKRFGRPAYSVAAKTGTAQVISRTYDTQKNSIIPIEWRHNSVFIAFAPVEKPQIALAVVVENNDVALEVARAVLDAYFKKL